jgi:uncharacterized coiled-coil DUF342 family protein
MNTRPTPETDEAITYFDDRCDTPVSTTFARKLEGERDEARETIATMEIRHTAVMLHTQSIVDEANEIREQRDRLADACRNLIDAKGRHNTEIAFNKMKDVFQSLKTKEL